MSVTVPQYQPAAVCEVGMPSALGCLGYLDEKWPFHTCMYVCVYVHTRGMYETRPSCSTKCRSTRYVQALTSALCSLTPWVLTRCTERSSYLPADTQLVVDTCDHRLINTKRLEARRQSKKWRVVRGQKNILKYTLYFRGR